jgi:hypothetical protein
MSAYDLTLCWVNELPVRRSDADSFPLVDTKSRVVDSYVGVVSAVTLNAAKIETKKMDATKTMRLRTTNKYSFSLKRRSLPVVCFKTIRFKSEPHGVESNVRFYEYMRECQN